MARCDSRYIAGMTALAIGAVSSERSIFFSQAGLRFSRKARMPSARRRPARRRSMCEAASSVGPSGSRLRGPHQPLGLGDGLGRAAQALVDGRRALGHQLAVVVGQLVHEADAQRLVGVEAQAVGRHAAAPACSRCAARRTARSAPGRGRPSPPACRSGPPSRRWPSPRWRRARRRRPWRRPRRARSPPWEARRPSPASAPKRRLEAAVASLGRRARRRTFLHALEVAAGAEVAARPPSARRRAPRRRRAPAAKASRQLAPPSAATARCAHSGRLSVTFITGPSRSTISVSCGHCSIVASARDLPLPMLTGAG